ncbi:MAG: PilZ domain-containing protein, partial [Phreatobacter sp.]
MRKNNRKAERRGLNYRSWISFDDGPCAIPCSLADVSETGARIMLGSAADMPQQFELTLTQNGRVTRRCLVVWRDDRALGVRFIDDGAEPERGNIPPADAPPSCGPRLKAGLHPE